MSFYCVAEATPLCETISLGQCDYCAWYQSGCTHNNYPVPAIPTRVVFTGDDYMYDTTYIEEMTIDIDGNWCPDHIVCLWDWNFDRNMDFGTPMGEMQMFFHDRLKGGGDNAY